MIVRSSSDVATLMEFLIYVRKRNGLSQAKVGELMGYADHSFVNQIERRGTNSIAILLGYAEAVGVELEVNPHGRRDGGRGVREGAQAENPVPYAAAG